MSKKDELRRDLIKLFQRTIDYDDPDRQYIGFLADKTIEMCQEYIDTYVKIPITQQELADRCGVSRQTVNSWIRNPEKITLKHLSTILNLSELATPSIKGKD